MLLFKNQAISDPAITCRTLVPRRLFSPAGSGVLRTMIGQPQYRKIQDLGSPNQQGTMERSIGHAGCEVRLSAEGWLSSGGARNVCLLPVCKYFPSRFIDLCRRSIVIRDSTCFTEIRILLLGMSGMEAASAGIALAGFVVSTIQQVDKIISSLRNARGDLSGLDNYLKQLKSSLTGAESLSKRLDGKADQQKALEGVKGAVEYCKKILEPLEARLNNINGSERLPSKLKKAMTSMKYSLKKDEILGVQSQLEYGMLQLNLAISTANANW